MFRTECSLIDLDNPTSSLGAREIDKLTFREFCVQRAQSDDVTAVADLLSVCLLGVESDEVSALYMLLYFKSGAGIDNIISDMKDGGQYLRSRQGKTSVMTMMSQSPTETNGIRKPNNLPKNGTRTWSGLCFSPQSR
jgi:monoamine oxidase